MPTAHIYTFSRLVHASPRDWEQMLASIEEGKPYAFSYYLPMREAVTSLCASRGHGREHIFKQMIARARSAGGVRGTEVASNNAHAFENFEAVFHPRIAKFRRSFLHEKHRGCEFEGLTLEGAPHFEAIDTKGRKRHVFLHASDWTADDLSAYLELLAIIVESRLGGDSSTIWPLDLKRGNEIKWRHSSRIRKRCANAAKLYVRFISAMENPEHK